MKNANPVFGGRFRLCLRFSAAVAAAGLAGCGAGRQAPPVPAQARGLADRFDIGLGGRTVHMQVAVLRPELERGLMERGELGRDEGMIFIFDAPQELDFWMRDTPTPLDVGYFTPEGVLAEVYPLLPYDERPVRSRGTRLQFALEMSQGWYVGNGVRPGARLDFAALAAALRARGFDPAKFGIAR